MQSGEPPRLFGVDPPRPKLQAVRIVDMTASNSWAEFAAIYRNTRQAFVEHEQAKAELKSLVPGDAKEASGMASAPNVRSRVPLALRSSKSSEVSSNGQI